MKDASSPAKYSSLAGGLSFWGAGQGNIQGMQMLIMPRSEMRTNKSLFHIVIIY